MREVYEVSVFGPNGKSEMVEWKILLLFKGVVHHH